MAAWIGLSRKQKDNCPKTDVDCRRVGWNWADGTSYNYHQYNEWCECKDEVDKYSDSGEKPKPQPEPGHDCAIIYSGKWFGVNCTGKEVRYLCFCEGSIDKLAKDSSKRIDLKGYIAHDNVANSTTPAG